MSRQVNLLIGGTLLILQLLLPALAPQLHQLAGCADDCCDAARPHAGVPGMADGCGVPAHRVRCGSGCAGHSSCRTDHTTDTQCPWHRGDGGISESRSPHPHECWSCAICQVLLAPRCAVVLLSLGECVAQVRLFVCPPIAATPAEPVYALPARAPPEA
jgi:hypothetical protein